MADLVGEAAQVLVPVLSMGAGAAVRDILERGGLQLSDAFWTFLERLRGHEQDKKAAQADIDAAVRAALADGQLADSDLSTLVTHKDAISQMVATSKVSETTVIRGKNVFSQSVINAENLNLS